MKKSLEKNPGVVRHKNLEEALMAFRHTMTSTLLQEAKKRGCTLSHFEVINYIGEHGNPGMKDIAKQLHITPPSASALVDTLVKKDLVARSHTSEDRRTVRVGLTGKAQAFLFSIHTHKSSVFNKMLSRLSVEDKNDLARILIKCT